jgi:predicted phage tail protein
MNKEIQTVILMCVAMVVAGALVFTGKASENLIAMVLGGVMGLMTPKLAPAPEKQ